MAETLTLLAAQYVRERVEAGDYAPVTAINVRCDLQAFAKHAACRPAELTSSHVTAWLGHGSPARSTRRRRYSYAKLFCQWLVRNGHLAQDPFLYLRSPKVPPSVPRGLRVDDVSKLIVSLPDVRARFIVVWMAQLGLRCVEISRLELADVDVELRAVRIVGKGGWQRLLPITEEAWAVLRDYLLSRGLRPGRLVDVTPNHLSRLVSGWMKDAGVPGTAHALRHSMATHLLRHQGADIKDVQAALGHQALTSTSVYLPFSDVERLRQVMEGRWYGPRVA